eukprot:GHVU01143067.1.p2 GENE.GHVU01143067.1~~GHVU01143067.1.p2  ORF type:complete len:125 (-),score=30.48 GHVU01143067.1:851-1225(-)
MNCLFWGYSEDDREGLLRVTNGIFDPYLACLRRGTGAVFIQDRFLTHEEEEEEEDEDEDEEEKEEEQEYKANDLDCNTMAASVANFCNLYRAPLAAPPAPGPLQQGVTCQSGPQQEGGAGVVMR